MNRPITFEPLGSLTKAVQIEVGDEKIPGHHHVVLHECSLCGAAVSNQDRHARSHQLESLPPGLRGVGF